MIKHHSTYESRFARSFCGTRNDMVVTIVAEGGDCGYCLDAVDPASGGAKRYDEYVNAFGDERPAFFCSDSRRE